MRWSPLSIVTQPVGELTRGEVRSFIGLKADNTAHDALLDVIRTGVVADAEFYLRRAVFSQRRRAMGEVVADCEPERRVIYLEPLSGVAAADPEASPPTEGDVVISGTARAFSLLVDGIRFDEPWIPARGDVISITYDAGYPPAGLPGDLRYALLAECQRRYERRVNPRGGQDGEDGMLKLDCMGKLGRYRAYNEPLNTDLVIGRGF